MISLPNASASVETGRRPQCGLPASAIDFGTVEYVEIGGELIWLDDPFVWSGRFGGDKPIQECFCLVAFIQYCGHRPTRNQHRILKYFLTVNRPNPPAR